MADIKLFEYHDKNIRTAFAEGQIWFVAKDVCAALGIGWVSKSSTLQAISDDWQRMMPIETTQGVQTMRMMNESAVYKFAFRSNKPEADNFTNWVAGEVIPQIRKTGRYVPKNQGILPLVSHTDINVQKDMSKSVNAYNYERGGKDETIAYNVASCLAHTGKTPTQIKREAKQAGLKSKDRQSSKTVMRATKPALASCMSVADNLHRQGFNIHRVFEVSKTAEPFFTKLIELGAVPAELKDK